MEVEGQLMAEQLSRSTDRQKGMSQNFALLVFSVVRHLVVMCSAGDGARPLPGSHWPALEGKGESGRDG